jgi:hypothetical protein
MGDAVTSTPLSNDERITLLFCIMQLPEAQRDAIQALDEIRFNAFVGAVRNAVVIQAAAGPEVLAAALEQALGARVH